jgi:anthranilate synthase component 1
VARAVKATRSPLSLYRARSLNPPLHVFLRHGRFQIVGASPEILVRQERTPTRPKVTIRPLAGTRPRGATPAGPALEADEGRPQERAEHLMLVGPATTSAASPRSAGQGDRAFVVERYSHVMHIVSNVEGVRRTEQPGRVRATFPAGTLTGAPKVARWS